MTNEASDTGLPASIEMAWGLRERPVKGPKPGMSLSQIVRAAVAVAESEGVGAVSMARVAERLGAKTMSLYRHVSAKEELLALMVDTAMGPPPDLPRGWRTGLEQLAWAQHTIYRRHPWVLRLPISAPCTPNQVAWLERGLAALADTKLTESAKLSVVLLVNGYVRNEATMVAEVNVTFRAAGATPTEALRAYGALLSKVTDPDRFPALRAALTAGVFDREEHPHEEFAFGLDRVLDGIAVMVAG